MYALRAYALRACALRALYTRALREDKGVFLPNHRVNELLTP